VADLEGRGFELTRHDLAKEKPTRELLGRLIDEHGLDTVLNTRSPAFKALEGRKLSKSEALDLMMKDANLIKRPLVLGRKTVFGYKPEEYDKL
jgi:Spx/MgsR family transcriptional regulator